MLPRCEGEFATLPPGIHASTLEEVYARFVQGAPESTRERRHLIYRALELHLDLVRRLLRGHSWKVWIDGGFTTDKAWKSPRDVDLLVITSPEAVAAADRDAAIPMWTLGNVTGQRGDSGPTMVTEKLHCMGGLVDAYLIDSDSPYQLELMRRHFASVKGPHGEIVGGATKGFVEVTFDA